MWKKENWQGSFFIIGLQLSFWLLFFQAFRIVFFLYHHEAFQAFSLLDRLRSMGHGLYMDLSIAAYLSLLPGMLWGLRPFAASPKILVSVLSWYQLLVVFCLSLISVADLEIFFNWGHRIDAAVLPYLAYPNEALASSLSAPLRILLSIFALGFMLPAFFWFGLHRPFLLRLQRGNYVSAFFSLLFSALLIIPIRGGFQLIPINQSSVYFSPSRQLNMASENPVWVLMQSVLESGQSKGLDQEYLLHKDEEVRRLTDSLFQKKEESRSLHVLKEPRPNIILLVWESLSAKVAACTGHAEIPCTPGLDEIAAKGSIFTQFFATGDRSDKGLAALLSGVPAVGKLSIMTQPNLVARLPFLSRRLAENGYSTTFLYGGELEFSNMKGFMMEAGFQSIVGQQDFPSEQRTSKWGVHDEFVLQKQLELAGKSKTPFFHTLFTLSSHEPFEVPGARTDPQMPPDSLFCRAHRYTDACIARWFQQAKRQDWWQNTWLIIVADHGHSLPNRTVDNDMRKFRIPMVWTGPALQSGLPKKFEMLGSQTDLPATVLHQLGIKASDFLFSQNLMDSARVQSAYFAFRHGAVGVGLEGDSLQPSEAWGSRYRQAIYQHFYQLGK